MSLLSTASSWSNDEKPKKRTPMMRQTLSSGQKKDVPKITSYNQIPGEYQEYKVADETKTDFITSDTESTIWNVVKEREQREERVNQILNQMTMVQSENDGGYLADFYPPGQPTTPLKRDVPHRGPDEPISALQNDMQHTNPPNTFRKNYDPYYISQMHSQGSGSNYNSVYDPSVKLKPYYSKMGIGSSNGGSLGNQDKLLERINYMIHLLENQEYEKTANITEEFILYGFLGIFVIFVLDSFSRTAKYTR
jgi:hypothetical protein